VQPPVEEHADCDVDTDCIPPGVSGLEDPVRDTHPPERVTLMGPTGVLIVAEEPVMFTVAPLHTEGVLGQVPAHATIEADSSQQRSRPCGKEQPEGQHWVLSALQ
jgi:hypothetical protein